MSISDVKIIRERRASIALKILSNGSIEVRAPHLIPVRFIEDFIKKNSDFIEKNKERIKQALPRKRKYTNGEKFLYLGEEHELKIGNFPSVKFDNKKILFPEFLAFRIEKEIENLYLSEAKEKITRLVGEYAEVMNTSFAGIYFSDTSSKWGSCSPDNRLQFNWRLIMAPLLVVRYVVIHELAHTTEKNHSRTFWSKVAARNPSYKEQIKWLKRHGNLLF